MCAPVVYIARSGGHGASKLKQGFGVRETAYPTSTRGWYCRTWFYLTKRWNTYSTKTSNTLLRYPNCCTFGESTQSRFTTPGVNCFKYPLRHVVEYLLNPSL
eukprot:6748425-Pyramimonas_sp.AAC.1